MQFKISTNILHVEIKMISDEKKKKQETQGYIILLNGVHISCRAQSHFPRLYTFQRGSFNYSLSTPTVLISGLPFRVTIGDNPSTCETSRELPLCCSVLLIKRVYFELNERGTVILWTFVLRRFLSP